MLRYSDESEAVDMMHPQMSQIVEEQSSVGPDASSSKSEYSGTPSSAIKKRRDKKFPETEYDISPRRFAQSAPPPKMSQTEFEYMVI